MNKLKTKNSHRTNIADYQIEIQFSNYGSASYSQGIFLLELKKLQIIKFSTYESIKSGYGLTNRKTLNGIFPIMI